MGRVIVLKRFAFISPDVVQFITYEVVDEFLIKCVLYNTSFYFFLRDIFYCKFYLVTSEYLV